MALKNNQTLAELQATWIQNGRLEWIGLRPAYRQDIIETEQAMLVAGKGIQGDHYAEHTDTGKRQITLIQAEYLPVIATLCGCYAISPAQLRRNLLVIGDKPADTQGQGIQAGRGGTGRGR